MNRPETAQEDRHRTFLICASLALLTLVLYLPTVSNDFVTFDDHEYITENAHVAPGVTWAGIVWAFTSSYASNWHPLTWISHMLDCQVFGLNPAGHHLTNVVLHTTNVVLLFLLFRRMTANIWCSAFIAALFAWHPLHVESVAWASERKDVLCAFFWLLTMLAYVKYVERTSTGKPGAGTSYALALLFFALGLMSKSMIVSLPCVLLLVDFWPLNRGSKSGEQVSLRSMPWPRLIGEKLPFLVLAIVAAAVTFMVQRGAMATNEHLPFRERAANASLSYMKYIGKAVWPVDLAAFYPYPHLTSAIPALVSTGLLCLLSAICLMAARSRPYLLTGWFWFLGALIPTIGLVQVGSQSMADRYMYLPSIGFSLAIVWCVRDLVGGSRIGTKVATLSGAIFLVICLPLTWLQIKTWHSTRELFQHAASVTTDNYVAYSGVGGALSDDKKYSEAIDVLSHAVAIKPRYPEAQYNLGTALLAVGRVEEAMAHFNSALVVKPDYAEAHANLANCLMTSNQPEEAYKHLLRSVEIKPEYSLGRYNMGTYYLQQSKITEAIEQFSLAVRYRPNYAEAHANLGVALMRAGKKEEGIKELETAAILEPDKPGYHLNLGLALMEANRRDKAEAAFSRVVQLQPDDYHARYNLGSYYLQMSRWPQAIEQLSEAIRLKPDYADGHANLGAALLRAGRKKEGLAELAEAVRLQPNDQDSRISLGSALMDADRLAEAEVEFLAAARLQPGDFRPHSSLGNLHARQHNGMEAIASYRESLRLKPDEPVTLNDLAWILCSDPDQTVRNGAEAVQLAKRASELTGNKEPAVLLTLANAQAEAGQFAEAKSSAEKGRELAKTAGDTMSVGRADKLLEVFAQGKPFREPR